MKVFDVHKFDMKKEQDFLQVQFNLKNRINLSPTIHPDSINTCAASTWPIGSRMENHTECAVLS